MRARIDAGRGIALKRPFLAVIMFLDREGGGQQAFESAFVQGQVGMLRGHLGWYEKTTD
jgi:hypothetical protein